MEYLRNAWYCAGWDSEIEPGKILARRYLDEPLVLFRDPSGTVKALAGICPHRMAPLGKR
ncbi:Rieske 2Fe-2S domain-containing protein [Paraburkholderia sp. MM5482-R1]|uniref:Rieske 2Fe-2S domain-containing protein n=1 Tax=unclassified Paraburkholderia TaxID=2615204 RepID=UPI003D19B593